MLGDGREGKGSGWRARERMGYGKWERVSYINFSVCSISSHFCLENRKYGVGNAQRFFMSQG